MKSKNFFAALLIVVFAASCTKDYFIDSPEVISENNDLKSASPHLKIAVVSDIHYFDPSLLPVDLIGETYFQEYLAQDPKLLEFSDPILRKVISELIAEKPDIVLVPGDLTKDGEKVSHETLATILKQLTDKGIKVYVIPGNHDIMNPYAFSFSAIAPVNSILPEEFASIYGIFGYNGSIRDANSLSYINKISDKLWILGIDACKYDENTSSPIVGGKIKPATMSWIQEKMGEARNKNVTVITMMHHGIMEHYYGQNDLDPGYVVDDWQNSATALMNSGIKVVFTGHYHANDITEFTANGKTLLDIETGSLVSWPSPYRIMVLYGNFISSETKLVTTINAPSLGIDFPTYSYLFHANHFDGYFSVALYYRYKDYGVTEEFAALLAPFFRNAIMAHYAGDENLVSPDKEVIEGLVLTAPPLAGALQSFWTDLKPKDNYLTLKVK
jgi:predicted MPP superfamily phosphohydrolase